MKLVYLWWAEVGRLLNRAGVFTVSHSEPWSMFSLFLDLLNRPHIYFLQIDLGKRKLACF